MKKLLFICFFIILLFSGCEKEDDMCEMIKHNSYYSEYFSKGDTVINTYRVIKGKYPNIDTVYYRDTVINPFKNCKK